jgi:hypothetical protein
MQNFGQKTSREDHMGDLHTLGLYSHVTEMDFECSTGL